MTAQRSLTLSQAALVFMSKNRGTLNSFLFDRLNLAVHLNEMPHKFNYSLPRAVNHRRTVDALKYTRYPKYILGLSLWKSHR